MLLQDLAKRGLINPEPFVLSNTMYLTVMGSHAYGCADTSVKSKMPDYDTYGFCIPPREVLLPNSAGHMVCFGAKPGTYIKFGDGKVGFEQFHKTHVLDKDAHGGNGQEYDFTIQNIVKYFELCRQNNPNMIDSLFTRQEHVLHCTQVGQMVRDARYDFLSKKVWKRFRGYAFEQLAKMTSKQCEAAKEIVAIRQFEDEWAIDHKTTLSQIEAAIERSGQTCTPEPLDIIPSKELLYYRQLYKDGLAKSNRFELHKFYSFDVKFAYNVIRLLDEAEQLLLTGDLDLQRAKEVMKSIRRGEWTPEQVREFCMQKDVALEAAYVGCKLPDEPDEKKLMKLLISCLEEHYGSLSNVLTQPDWATTSLRQIDEILREARTKLYS
jgi:predicted nucleotidyltransferase